MPAHPAQKQLPIPKIIMAQADRRMFLYSTGMRGVGKDSFVAASFCESLPDYSFSEFGLLRGYSFSQRGYSFSQLAFR